MKKKRKNIKNRKKIAISRKSKSCFKIAPNPKLRMLKILYMNQFF